MADILAENLSGKSVMGADGTELGRLYNITMDLPTGKLDSMLVEPMEDTEALVDFPTDDSGRFEIPVSRVRAVKDYIVVER